MTESLQLDPDLQDFFSDEEEDVNQPGPSTAITNAPKKRKRVEVIADDDIDIETIPSAQPTKKERFQEKWTTEFKTFIANLLIEICIGLDKDTFSEKFSNFILTLPKNLKSTFWVIYRVLVKDSEKSLATAVLQNQASLLRTIYSTQLPSSEIRKILSNLQNHFSKANQDEIDYGTSVSKTPPDRVSTLVTTATEPTGPADVCKVDNSWLSWDDQNSSLLQKHATQKKEQISSCISVINTRQNTQYTWNEEFTKPFHFTLQLHDAERMVKLSKQRQWTAKVRDIRMYCNPNDPNDILGQHVKAIVTHSQKTLRELLNTNKTNVEINEKVFKSWYN
ncbi:uncharacterized protein LOC126100835 [Schistocerca cancellata]|uniref:uncharacterized protein LOC126100835 n=1 Tax=Schistocerca cancellata TaxID=274614 RepID=UPI0021194BB5|nr:uncharacterized protein LOC126100835 [Schistocerca cancellata]